MYCARDGDEAGEVRQELGCEGPPIMRTQTWLYDSAGLEILVTNRTVQPREIGLYS